MRTAAAVALATLATLAGCGGGDDAPEALFTAPAPGAAVPRTFTVAGQVQGLDRADRVYLVAQSQASGALLFPLGPVPLDEEGRFSREVTLLFEYPHRLTLVRTADAEEAAYLSSSHHRYYGLDPAWVAPETLVTLDITRVDDGARLGPSGTAVASGTWPPPTP